MRILPVPSVLWYVLERLDVLLLVRHVTDTGLQQLGPTGEREDNRNGIIVNENGRIPRAEAAFDHYESIFYAFYNKELKINNNDMSAALGDCYQLLHISEYLGCTGVISKGIEVSLFNHGQELYRAIQSAPNLWIEMAYRIRSEMMFKECMIHLVGNWKIIKNRPRINEHIRAVPGLRALIEKYHRQLLTQCRSLELGIMSLYPGEMKMPSPDIPIKREAYSKDILVWMALTFFRHWIGQRLILEKGRHSLDCGYELYKQIGSAGESYMDKSVINQFHTKFPMTKKAMNVLENHLLEIKECMKGVVDQHAILKSHSQLETAKWDRVHYLTCVDFKADDYPWLKDDTPPARVAPAKREYKPGGNEIARQNLETAKRYQERSLSVEEDDDDEFADEDEMEDDEDEVQTKRTRVR